MTDEVLNASAEVKASLMDKVVTAALGRKPMKIVSVGNYCPAEDTIYLHLYGASQSTKAKPAQYFGWYYLPWIEEGLYSA
jgi:hypothetical protein